MADGDSGNFDLVEPEVGASDDTWGTKLNAGLTLIDAALSALTARHIDGLTLSTAGGSATFAVAAGMAGDSTGAMMIRAASISKTTGTWAVGSGNGSLDTGAIANDTWYHAWLIKRPDTGVVDVLTSLSATAPTLPTNYTLKRRIGAMKTNGSAQWIGFAQDGDEFLWLVPGQDLNTSSLGTSELLTALSSVPSGVAVTALMRGDMNHASPNTFILVNSPHVTNAAPSAGNYTAIQQVGSQAVALGELRIRTNTSAQVRSRSSAATTTLELNTYGWVDPRGRN